MSQENKGEHGLVGTIQYYHNRMTKLQGDLDAAREESLTVNEARIKELKEELEKLRGEVKDLCAIQVGFGVGSSPQSKYCIDCRWLCCLPLHRLSRRFTWKVALLHGPFCCFLDNHSSC